ncbi:MAG: hypothetical protein JWM11_2568 [Planctomycetaceae bacterium]|nr:hypothetical protein [Planctomycetaceae bacterium]
MRPLWDITMADTAGTTADMAHITMGTDMVEARFGAADTVAGADMAQAMAIGVEAGAAIGVVATGHQFIGGK